MMDRLVSRNERRRRDREAKAFVDYQMRHSREQWEIALASDLGGLPRVQVPVVPIETSIRKRCIRNTFLFCDLAKALGQQWTYSLGWLYLCGLYIVHCVAARPGGDVLLDV